MAQTTGFEELKAKLETLSSFSEVKEAVRAPMTKAAADVLKESMRMVPRDRGQLINSASLVPEETSDSITITIGYGTVYAYKVHENPRSGKTGGVGPHGQRYKHWAAVGEYKYLEKPMKAAEQTFWPKVGEGVDRWLQSLGR